MELYKKKTFFTLTDYTPFFVFKGCLKLINVSIEGYSFKGNKTQIIGKMIKFQVGMFISIT